MPFIRLAGQAWCEGKIYLYAPDVQGRKGCRLLARTGLTVTVADGQDLNLTVTLNPSGVQQ
jgi:hypothetical protein